MPLFLSNSCHFSVHKTEISKFLARIHMKYFQMGIFVITGVCLIIKYGSQTTTFFSVFQCFSGYRAVRWRKMVITSCHLYTKKSREFLGIIYRTSIQSETNWICAVVPLKSIDFKNLTVSLKASSKFISIYVHLLKLRMFNERPTDSIGPPNRLFSIATKRWRWERFM